MKKEKVTVTVEKDTDGRFACYVDKEFAHFGLAGYGDTVAEAKADLYACYNEMKELEEEEGRSIPDLEYTFKYDIQSFFNNFPYLNISRVAEMAHINPTLMRQYACGVTKAGEKQYDKLQEAVKNISMQLASATF